MKIKIKRLSDYGKLFPPPCEKAFTEIKVDEKGLSPIWYININSMEELVNLVTLIKKDIIIQENGTLLIYDDYLG